MNNKLKTMDKKYPLLMEEIHYLNKGFGWNGYVDALRFIKENMPHYDQLASEFVEFNLEMRKEYQDV